MTAPEPVRLQKYLADAGVCSRRAAETLIAEGEVLVNGAPATLGQKIVPGTDKVIVSGRTVRSSAQPRLTLAVHKPRGLICSNDDPHHEETIFNLLPPELARLRFFCAGRLDKDSEGLVILTTDGDLANRLMHPRHLVVKRYQVRLERPFEREKLPRLLKGVMVEGERLKVERAALLQPSAHGSLDLDVWMHHGKKREIRQLFLALGYPVKRLRRYQVGAFRLRGLPMRALKALTPREVESLFQVPSAPMPDHGAACVSPASPAAARHRTGPGRGQAPRSRRTPRSKSGKG